MKPEYADILKKTSQLSGDDPLEVAYPNGSGFDERDRIQEHRGKTKFAINHEARRTQSMN
ncbi:MAG: hypothetical protein ABR985_00645 [Methanotrichaceae archaeon]|jgi:hypothetical protein